MSHVIDLLKSLDEGILLEGNETFKKSELTPVMFGKPGAPGQGSGLPQPTGEAPKSVEVINVEEAKDQKQQGQGGQPQQGKGGPPQKGGKPQKGGGAPSAGQDAPGPGEKKEVKLSKENMAKEGKGDGKGEKRPTRDAHAILETSDAAEIKDMAEKILEKAEQARKDRNVEGKGEGEGGYMDKLRDLHKPKIDWANELKRRITEFKSRTTSTINRMSQKKAERYKEGEGIQKSKSYLTYLRDPKSHTPGSKILYKGPYVKAPVSEIVLIVALDTSGSIGESTIGKVFGEMDKIASAFKRGFSAGTVKLEGRVYFMTWDTAVHNAEEYKAGGWKVYKEGKKGIGGRGGTDLAGSLFKYLKEHTHYDPEKPSAALLNIIKKPASSGMSKDDIVIPVKGEGSEASAVIAPFLIIATDGYFGGVNDKDLGLLFKDNHKNILYLIIDGSSESCYPKSKENIINYETYRI